MGPKKTKKSNVPEFFEYNSWVSDIGATPIVDETFDCFIAVIAPRDISFLGFTDDINTAIINGNRTYFKSISRTTILRFIQTNCGKAAAPSALTTLCDEIKKVTGIYFDTLIPGELAAYLVKYMILNMKKNYLKDKDDTAVTAQSRDALVAEFQGAPATTAKDAQKSKDKTAKKGKEEEEDTSKKDTKLHKRGKYRRDQKGTIDDAPSNSPSLFIVISDILDPTFLTNSLMIGVPVRMIINLGMVNDTTETSSSFQLLSHFKDHTYNILSEVRLNKREKVMPQSVIEKNEAEITQFWNVVVGDYWDYDTCKFYSNTVYFEYTPEFIRELTDVTTIGSEDASQSLYKDICYFLYDYQDYCTMYPTYLEQCTTVDVPLDYPLDINELSWYNAVLDAIPNEIINVPFLLDTLICQICLVNEEPYGYNIEYYIKPETEDEPAEKLLCTQEKVKSLNEDLEKLTLVVENENGTVKPSVVISGDDLHLKSLHLENVASLVKERTMTMLSLLFNDFLWNSIYQQEPTDKEIYLNHRVILENVIGLRDKNKIAEMLVTLVSFDLPKDDPCPAREYLKFESGILELSGAKNLRHASTTAVGKVPECTLLECKQFTRLVSPTHGKNSLINEAHYFENMPSSVMVQKLFSFFPKLHAFTARHCPIYDSVLLNVTTFKNYSEWSGYLPTPPSLRDFIQFDIQEIPQWVEAYLRILNPPQPQTNTDLLETLGNPPVEDPIEPIKITEEFILETSEWVVEDNLEVIEDDDEEDGRDPFIPKTEVDAETLELPPFSRTVYDIGEKCKVNMKGCTFQFRTGNTVEVDIEYTIQLFERDKISIFVSISSYKLFYFTESPSSDSFTQFRVESDDGLIISIFEEISTLLHESEGSEDELDEQTNDKFILEEWPYSDKESSFMLKMQFPTGQTLETIRLDDELIIKQSAADETENFRYVLKDGSVLRFLKDQNVEILYPHGKILTILYSESVKEQDDEIEGETEEIIKYRVIQPEGLIEYYNNEELVQVEEQYTETHYDPFSSMITITRHDGTIIEITSDSKRIVTFPDKTRITSRLNILTEDYLLDWDDAAMEEWFTYDEYQQPPTELSTSPLPMIDSASFKFITPQSGIYSPLGSVPDIKVGSWYEHEMKPVNKNSSSIQYIPFSDKHKIFRPKDGFILTDMTFMVEHPKYARIHVHPTDISSMIVLPNELKIVMYDDGVFDFSIEDDYQIKITQDKIIFKEMENDMCLCEGYIFLHANHKKFDGNFVPLFILKDIQGNEICLDCRGLPFSTVDFKTQPQTTEHRYFSLNRDLSGFEILRNHIFEQQVKKHSKIQSNLIQEYKNIPFIDHLFLKPIKNLKESWIQTYVPVKDDRIYDLPSTYGNRWCFAFKEPKKKPETHDLLEVRLIKRLLLRNPIEIFNDIMNNYSNALTVLDERGKFPKSCDCLKSTTAWESAALTSRETQAGQLLYKKGKIIIKNPGPKFTDFIKNYLIGHASRVNLRKLRNKYARKEFHMLRNEILNERVPCYFQSSFGIGYLEMMRMFDIVWDKVDKKKDKVERLLEIPMSQLTDANVDELIYTLNQIKKKQPKSKTKSFNIEELLRAGLALRGRFRNMKEFLEYHAQIHYIKPLYEQMKSE